MEVNVVQVALHDDPRRTIFPVFNSEDGEFVPGQVKVLVVKEDCWLGGQAGHYHEYGEAYLNAGGGQTTFYLQNIDDPQERQEVVLRCGEKLIIPAHVAHKVEAKKGAILIGLTAEPYRGSGQDIPFAVQTD